ncbi:MAG TPA: hypothetical protein VGE64_02555 [Xanthomonadaceae bacterium]
MKPFLFALSLLSPAALACDAFHVPLSGTATVETCSPNSDADCVYSERAVYEYIEAVPDPEEAYTIGLPSSPWRLYDGQMRILLPEELADTIRSELGGKVERVELIGSWTGVAPAPGLPSLAERVSKALDGFPVKGEDGFLWLTAQGARRTTRQAFTARQGAGSYFLPKGAEVFVSLAVGWPLYVEDMSPDDPELAMRAAVGHDVFSLCPDKALAGFERAAGKGSAIAAYNAAMMRLERNEDGDRVAALALLQRGAELGDAKSRERLDVERKQGTAGHRDGGTHR